MDRKREIVCLCTTSDIDPFYGWGYPGETFFAPPRGDETSPEPVKKPSRGTFMAPGWARPDLDWTKR